MNEKVVAIAGSYRKGGITDQAVDAALAAAQKKGAEVEKIYLIERHIEFCTNCRVCSSQDSDERRGRCVLKDEMALLLDKIDASSGLILASPINFYTVTAVMKRFIERFIVYAYWPWLSVTPKNRIKAGDKKAVVITSSACPAFVGKLLLPNALQILRVAAQAAGAKVVKSIYFGAVAMQEKQQLNEKQLKSAVLAGNFLV